MITPYLTDPLVMLTDTIKFFNPNQYLPKVNAYVAKAIFNRS